MNGGRSPAVVAVVAFGATSLAPSRAAAEPRAVPGPWEVDVGAALVARPDDAYVRRLDVFGYRPDGVRGALALGVRRAVRPGLAAGVRLTRLSSERWSRPTELEPLQLTVVSHALTATVRARRTTGRVGGWLEAGVGATWARTRFEDEADRATFDDHLGIHAVAAAGVAFSPRRDGVLAVAFEVCAVRAPTVDNLLAPTPDTLDVGGVLVGAGLVVRPR